MIKMMYCATCVQVTARIPPSIEHTRMPSSPTKIAISKGMSRKREVMMPMPKHCATIYVKDAQNSTITPQMRAVLPS